MANWFKNFRFRYISMLVGSLAALVMILLTDPDLASLLQLPFGARAVITFKTLLMVSVAAAFIHYARKTLFDYFDLSEYLIKAKESATGAGLAIIGVAVMLLATGIVFAALTLVVN